MYPVCLNDLIESFKKFPGIGQKTAERMAFSVLFDFENSDVDDFRNSLKRVKSDIRKCKICNCITDGDLCFVCDDKARNSDVLVVVENSKDLFLLEKIGNFDGYYHVLGGLISPFDDIGPSDISIASLVSRVKDG